MCKQQQMIQAAQKATSGGLENSLFHSVFRFSNAQHCGQCVGTAPVGCCNVCCVCCVTLLQWMEEEECSRN